MNPSEIQSLSSEVERLTTSVDLWNSAIVWMMIVAATAATGLVITQFIAFQKAKQLANLESRLSQVKDTQLNLDLKDKDQKIAEAQERAATAQKLAEGFKRDIATANQRAAEANEKAELEKLARIRLEHQVVGRHLSGSQRATLVKILKAHPDYVAVVTTWLDLEGSDYADDFDAALRDAKWITQRIPARVSSNYGISIGAVNDTMSAGLECLANALHAAGIQYRKETFSAADHSIPGAGFQPGTIYLVIGRKHEPKGTE